MPELTPRPRRTTKTYKDLRVLRGGATKSPVPTAASSDIITPPSTPDAPISPRIPSRRRKSMKFFIGLGVGIILIFAVLGWYLIVQRNIRALSESPLTLFTARIFGMSVAKINTEEIPYTNYRDQLRATKMFFDTDTTGNLTKLSDREMQDYVLARLLINELTGQVAREYKVTLETSELDQLVQTQLIQNFGSREKAEENIRGRYGWTLEQFVENIIKPAELERKLVKVYLGSIGYPVPKEVLRERAEGVLSRIKAGEDFEVLAREFGMDSTAESGGNVGWFVRGMFETAVEDTVFSLENGQVAPELVETENGFYIVRADDRKTGQDPETGREREEMSAHMIFFRIDKDDAAPYAEYMNKRLLESKVTVKKGIVNPLANFYAEQNGT